MQSKFTLHFYDLTQVLIIILAFIFTCYIFSNSHIKLTKFNYQEVSKMPDKGKSKSGSTKNDKKSKGTKNTKKK